MAGLTQRGNVWVATWRNPDGTRTQQTTKVKVKEKGKTKKETREYAQMLATQMEHLAKGTSPLDKVLKKVRDIAEDYGYAKPVPSVAEFFRDYPATASASTEKDRRTTFARFSEFLGKRVNHPVSKLTPDDCRGFLRYLLPLYRKGTVELHRRYLSCALRRAVREGHLSQNPLEGISVDKEMIILGLEDDTEKREALTPDELAVCLDPARMGQDWADMTATCLYTLGARLGDCACLLWENVNFETNTLCFTERKTKQKRELPLTPELRSVFLRRKENGTADATAIFPEMRKKYTSSNGVLSTEFSTLLRANGITGRNTTARSAKGNRHNFSTKTFHSIRHSVVTMLRADNRLSADVVRKSVGHHSEEVEQGYIGISRTDTERVLAVLTTKLNTPAVPNYADSPLPPPEG